MGNITNGEIKQLISCLNEISQDNFDLPIKIWYALSKNKDRLESADVLTEKMRIDLVKKYGEKGENDVFTVPEEKKNAFQNDYIELLNLKSTINFHMIPMGRLEELKTLKGINGIYLFFKYIVDDSEHDQCDKKEEEMEVVKDEN